VLPFLFSLIVFIFACINPLSAADINLTITQKNLTESVLVKITNSSPQGVVVESVEIGLNKKQYLHSVRDTIKAGAVRDFIFSIQTPHITGSYILLTTVKYLNDGALLTVKHADFYHHRKPALLSESCKLETTTDDGRIHIHLTAPQDNPWSLVVPDELEVIPALKRGDTSTYQVKSTAPGFITTNQIFGTTETMTDNVHRAAFCSAILTTKPRTHFPANGWMPGYFFLILTAIFFALCAVLILMLKYGQFAQIMLRYGGRMFFLSISCFLLKEISGWLASSTNYLTWSPYQWFARILLDHINGGNYHYFFQFFIDGYFVLCLLLIFPCLYWLDGQRPASDDKYVACFTTLLTLPRLLIGKRPFWNDLGRLGLLTIMVKFFFTPMMVSWAIGGFYTMINGLHSFQWNVYAVNAYLVQLLILVDTVIFSLGYLIESKYLKNEIKSVEPTVLGWIVCLWCYPPFNSFAFKPLDFYIVRISLPHPAWINIFVLCTITCLWAIFVWASVAFGFKASNLTNRGIVKSGPYRFVRHPAYTAKLLIWILQGIFFAQFGIFILLGFIVIYLLRAWTEERHLSSDPGYLTYKQSVRRWFIPGVI
jgi:protein-S-isoprenylcysteine O-methyltransferase Ste14